MKKFACNLLILLCCVCFILSGCDKTDQTQNDTETPAETTTQSGKNTQTTVDVDLSKLSSTMAYSEVYRMTSSPEDYVGKKVKISGTFKAYSNKYTGGYYFFVMVTDATACCSQGLEFILTDDVYPDNYPEVGATTTVTGTFDTYDENGTEYCHLIKSEISG